MHLEKFVGSNTGKYMMSILLGLGLATIFRAACQGKKCKTIVAPPLSEIEDKIYRFDDKCYKIQKSATKCDKKKQTINFA